MMPDVTITVRKFEIDKTHIGHQHLYEETSGPCAHKSSNSLVCSKKLSGASPYMEFYWETSLLYMLYLQCLCICMCFSMVTTVDGQNLAPLTEVRVRVRGRAGCE
jgi:hypothetical protein